MIDRRILKLFLAGLAAALLSACASVAGQHPILSRYHGVHVDLFFLEWGAPVSSHPLKFGGTEYLWYSGRNSAYRPGQTDTDLIGNTAWWEGYQLKMYDPRLECGVRIVTSPDGTIRELLVHQSSRGWWEVPRCARIFKRAGTLPF